MQGYGPSKTSRMKLASMRNGALGSLYGCAYSANQMLSECDFVAAEEFLDEDAAHAASRRKNKRMNSNYGW